MITYLDMEEPVGGDTHLSHFPSFPLTCSTLDQQEEEREEQVQDLHADTCPRSSRGYGGKTPRQQGHGGTWEVQKPGHSGKPNCRCVILNKRRLLES